MLRYNTAKQPTKSHAAVPPVGTVLELHAYISYDWFTIKRLWYRCRVQQPTTLTLLREGDHFAEECAQCERKVSEIGGNSKHSYADDLLENTDLVYVHNRNEYTGYTKSRKKE